MKSLEPSLKDPGRKPRIWFNTNLSNTAIVIRTIRESCAPGEEFFFVGSHTNPKAPISQVADLFEVEPTGLGSSGYVQWCLDFVRRHDIDLFIPRNHVAAIAANSQLFEAEGVKLILPADAATIELIKHKAYFYEFLGADLVPQPDYRLVGTLEAFQSAYAELAAKHQRVCYKPPVGIGGRGFKIITTGGEKIFSEWDQEQLSVDYDEAVAAFAASESFPELMMMQFVPGLERSVDCLARDGKLLGCIVRVKSADGKDELLEGNPLLVEYSRRVTAKARLNGLYNVQFLEAGGEQYLLEVNSRMSGGTHYGALSGVVYPYWAIRLALGTATEGDIPTPKTGIWVDRATRQIVNRSG